MGTSPKFPASRLAIYAAPAFAMAMPTIPIYVLLPAFYAETIGLGFAATGAALLAARYPCAPGEEP